MSRGRPTIAFDFSRLDHLNLGNGQYRYCVDLLNGLSQISPEADFLVVGSRVQPPAEISGIFAGAWRYLHAPISRRRGADYLAHATGAWLLRRERVDLQHTPHSFLPLLSRIRAVVTIHDMMAEIFPEYANTIASRPYRLFKYAVQRRRPAIVAISQSTSLDLQRLWHVPASDISVVHLGAAPLRSAGPIDRDERNDESPFILSPYNLEPRKNLKALMVAVSQVRQTRPDIRLVLYGRAALTPERELEFRKDVSALELQDVVTLTGFVPDDQLANLYRRAAVFVFPSLYEGFGLPVLEAMAAGACTIARNQSSMREVLDDAGVQVETADPAAMSSAILALLDDPVRREALGRAAARRASQFTQEAMARGTLAVYMRALGRG